MQDFQEILSEARKCNTPKIAVAVAQDEDVLLGLDEAVKANLVEPILVGDGEEISAMASKLQIDISSYQLIDIPDKLLAVKEAVALVHKGKAELLMKGMIGTAELLKAILDKEIGLRLWKVLSHVAVMKLKNYHKFLLITDAGINIELDLDRKVHIINNAIQVAKVLNIKKPKVVPLAAVEVINPNMQATIDAAALSKMCERGQIKDCIIDGPLAFDNAISLEAAQHKGITSSVAGDADILLAHNIEAGNLMYKSFVYLAEAKTAGIVVGAKVPIVVTSRSDSSETKLYSIALGVLMASRQAN
ncbi:MAG: phosphate butyryltransferase [Bacillota bacterium]|nr:phosphate butyryltransferase [Bacillota bacterium]